MLVVCVLAQAIDFIPIKNENAHENGEQHISQMAMRSSTFFQYV